jgi:hypothetical protein
MSRDEREPLEPLARLGSDVSPPSDDELRAMARAASSRSRPLPSPIPRRRWPLRAGWTGVLVGALVVAIGLGVALGALIAPSGTAAPGPVGTGFLPGPGWTVLQTGEDATFERQALAVASNVPLHPEDDARGIRGSSGLPYSTLLGLPPRGVVIVALFTRRESEPWNDEEFPTRELPLTVRDAMTSISYGYQVRPQRPLGQYELRATVGDHHIVLHFYFGTRTPSPRLLSSAQRQLDRLVVASLSSADVGVRRPSVATEPSASKTIDRTVMCELGNLGGVFQFEVQASAPVRSLQIGSSLSATTHRGYGLLGRVGGWGLSIDAACKPAPAIPVTPRGLGGGVVRYSDERYDCFAGRGVLIRVRGLYRSPVRLKRERVFGSPYLTADQAVREGQFAIRTQPGKPLVYGDFVASKRTRLFVADSCVRDHIR